MDESILINRTSIPTDWESDVSTKEVKNEIEVSVSAFSSITSRISALLRYSGLTTQVGFQIDTLLLLVDKMHRFDWLTESSIEHQFENRSQSGCNLPSKLIQIISQSSPWQISLSPCGQYLAILRRNHLELRSAADNFYSVNQTQISKDKNCEWRKIFWSAADWLAPDSGCTLAVSLSSGKVFLFDINLSVIKVNVDEY